MKSKRNFIKLNFIKRNREREELAVAIRAERKKKQIFFFLLSLHWKSFFLNSVKGNYEEEK